MLTKSAVSSAESEKVEVVTNKPFVALWAELPEDRADCTISYIISCPISFGTDIDAIKTKCILVYYSVNAIVARSTKRATRLFSVGSAIPHAEKKIHY